MIKDKYFNLYLTKVRIVFAAVLSCCILAGCSPKLDTSSRETYDESLQNMVKGLTSPQKDELKKILLFYVSGKRPDKILQLALQANSDSSMLINISELNGLTYDEIVKKYDVDYKTYQEILLREKSDKELEDTVRNKIDENKFDDAISIISASEFASDELKASLTDEVRNKKSEYESKREYFKNILIDNVVTQRIDTTLEENVPAIRFSLKNLGNKTVTDLKVKVFFRDSKNNVILEHSIRPIFKDSFVSEIKKPLKPGYIKEPEKDNYYTVDQPLNEWVPENTTLVIEDINLEDSDIKITVDDSEHGNGDTEIKAKTPYIIKVDEYQDLIEVSKFSARMIDTYDGSKPGVRFAIKNLGNLTISRLEMTVFYKNKSGTTIHEETFYPILVSKYSFGRNIEPLAPCQTRRMENDRYYTVKYELENWDPKLTEYKITDISFQRPEQEVFEKPKIEKVCK